MAWLFWSNQLNSLWHKVAGDREFAKEFAALPAEIPWNLLTLVQIEFSGHDTEPISCVDVGRFWVGVNLPFFVELALFPKSLSGFGVKKVLRFWKQELAILITVCSFQTCWAQLMNIKIQALTFF